MFDHQRSSQKSKPPNPCVFNTMDKGWFSQGTFGILLRENDVGWTTNEFSLKGITVVFLLFCY